MTTFVIPGKPFAKQRPRFNRRSGQAFTPSETVSFERTVGTIAAGAFDRPLAGPVRVEIWAEFEMPASWPKKRRAIALGQPHTQRPDLDNIAKATLDGINRIAFADDAQVCQISVSKQWGERGRTIVTVEEVE